MSQEPIIEQIYATLPVDGGFDPLQDLPFGFNTGFDTSIFSRDLDYMDMLGAAEDEELFRMLGVNDATAQDEKAARQSIAAQKYINAVGEYRSSPNAINKQILDDAKQALVDLDVSRSTIEGVTNRWFPEGIDASGAISDVMGPSISGALKKGIEKGSELFGLGAEGLASLVGADKALSSALLNLPKPGITFVFDDSGKKTPIITGQTSGGTQVGVNANDPYGIADIISGIRTGDLDIYDLDIYDIIGAGGKVLTGGKPASSLTGDADPNKKTGVETGVAITPEGSTPDEPKIPAGGEGGGPNKDKGAGFSLSDKTPTLKLPESPTNRTPALTLPDFPTLSLPSDRTLTLPDFDPLETERVPTSTTTPASTVTPADKIPGGGGGGGGGGSGLPQPSASPTGGMRGVATEQAGVADITLMYDPSLSFAENMERMLGKKKNKQADAVDSVLMYGGGIVQPTDLNDELSRIIGGR